MRTGHEGSTLRSIYHPPRKRRTRQHVIADLSMNHVERHVLLAGHTVFPIRPDYGLDLAMVTYSGDGEVEPGILLIQVKSSDAPRFVVNGQAVAVTVERADLSVWLMEPLPVVLIMYDAQRDVAFWLYVQASYEPGTRVGLSASSRTVTLRIPTGNVVTADAMDRLAQLKNDLVLQAEGTTQHHV
jgi:hypothetical protein